ncbi:MAG: amino acid permease [Bryobacteraceae bacterium]
MTSSERQERIPSRFGYAQELFRAMGGFSNFAISFSIISILTGCVTLFGYGLEMGGPLEMGLGWPVATVFTLTLAASMAELCSAFPTSGAMYHWTVALGGRGAGWFVACLNILGLVAAQAAIDYSCAQFSLPFLGIAVSPRNVFLMFSLTLITHGAINCYGVRLLAVLNDCSVAVHIVGVLAIAGSIFWLAPTQPPRFLLQASNSNGQPFYWWAFLLGLLQAQWTYTGFDGSAHMAEETVGANTTAPWGMVLAVAVSGALGYVLLIALTLGIQSTAAVFSAKDAEGNAIPAAIAVLRFALGVKFGNAIAALASMAMWFCGLACVASASRAVYSLARDGGLPWHSFFSRVNPRHGTPGAAVWAVVLASVGVMAWTGAVPIVTSLSTVALYLAYIVPVVLGLRARGRVQPWVSMAAWNLGRWGPTVNAVAICYTGLICLVLVMPPNALAGKALGAVAAVLGVAYWSVVRRNFRGPEWAAKAARFAAR